MGLTREIIILTIFTEFIWLVLWTPFNFFLDLNFEQWLKYFIYSVPYDLLLAYISSKIIIKFNEIAKNRKWY
jgi:hypothetical protein